ncbi:type I-E CRISPR-associated protein Cse1/CasA [Ruegeria marisrubri]|uniref:type I-E CRISPR-associated protein Cse1/CasA n=1 Tax=Ruegeria marisrubri TaxID=1685379 RepID=UPI001CD75A48|nr:type I-E CRISPR-associated protein Cse1/CasA [Ruegeria marisrubri]MCA0906954.1 type I-E CRISPR-associated protein Cse1/CasA [Ruegeria marisrubri]
MNLIADAWIPVRRTGGRDVIRPDQIAEPDVLFPDWPRADLNLACLELLIGLVYLACPAQDADDWAARRPDPQGLRDALAPLAPAFNLLGEGPRFLQDFDPIDGSLNPPDMLFIDSAGDSTAKKNADLMVKRARYPRLDPALAAMALYTLQAFAPSGGAGNRTSMRGGGPMVTLVRPEAPGLWPLIWANVPDGVPLGADELDELPWMRPTETSENEQLTVPPDGDIPHPEVFFGQPRRLRLEHSEGKIQKVVQKKHGTMYHGWLHPLSPYYHDKNEKRCKHPKPGAFGYRNWRGIVLLNDGADRAQCLETFLNRTDSAPCRLLVGGWAMSNMSPLDFIWSEAPVFPLDPQGEDLAGRLVEAAEQAGYALASAVRQGRGEDDLTTGAGARAREVFFAATQASFEARLRDVVNGQGDRVPEDWLKDLRGAALRIFDAEVMPGLADLSETRRQAAVAARKSLLSTFSGYGGVGVRVFKALRMPPPKTKRKAKAEART